MRLHWDALLLFWLLTSVFGFLISYILLSYYTLGDQIAYHAFYENLTNSNISQIPLTQFKYTGSAEPAYGVISWVGANSGLTKNIYTSLFNCFFIVTLIRYLIVKNANVVFIFLALTNFYFVVLLTGAERLKFSYIFLLLALSCNKKNISLLLYTIATLNHFSTIMLIASSFSGRISEFSISKKFLVRKIPVKLVSALFVIVITLIIFSQFQSQLIGKIAAYLGNGSALALTNISLLFFVSAIVFPKRPDIFFSLITMSIAVFLLGADRVNMLAVTIFLYFAVDGKKTSHPLVLALMLYFSVKSIPFIYNIFVHGNGFIRL